MDAQQSSTEVYSAAAMLAKTSRPDLGPRINGAPVFGARPGSPVLHRLAVSGVRPMQLAADALPGGIAFDAKSGVFSGRVISPGSYPILVRAANAHGSATRTLLLEIGERHLLTPPMGWNSWNCWGGAVSEDRILEAARAMIALGLADHGWTYVNVDDGWQGARGGPFNAIQPNGKFRDMGELGRQIHELGLKFGLYSTPWIGTYEGHIGSYSPEDDGSYPWIAAGDCNEFTRIGRNGSADWDRKRRANWVHGRHSFVAADVAQWSAWGVDYLKYDWKPNDVEHTREMAGHLRGCGRDIALSLSNKAPFRLAAEWARHASCWRTTEDIQDTWESVASIGFAQDRWNFHSGPGHWNDPDMLVVGRLGWGGTMRPSRLTQEEQCTHFGLWCLLSAPLLLGCDFGNMDEFTLRLLTNDEVIAIDQDPLGAQAVRIGGDPGTTVMAKPMMDGSTAVGLFNLGETPRAVKLDWDDLHCTGPHLVRDVWSRTTEGVVDSCLTVPVAPHGMKLVRIQPAQVGPRAAVDAGEHRAGREAIC